MKLHLSVKVDRRFLQSDSHNYGLVAYLEDYKSKELYFNRMIKDLDIDLNIKNDMGLTKWEDELVSALQGERESNDVDSAALEITQNDLYYKIDISIPKSMFHEGDQIRVIVEAIPFFDGCSVVIYGASQVIT